MRKRDRTRLAILDAAEPVFTAHGFRATRMEEIAEAAGVSVGSLYGHFGNKDGLYTALALRAVGLFDVYMEQCYVEGRTALEQVMAAGDAYLRFHLEHPGAFRFLAFDGVEAAVPAVDDALHAQITDDLERILGKFQATIARAMDDGESDPADARAIARFLWGAWNGVVALGLRTDRLALGDDEIAACLQMGRRVVLAGLASRDTPPATRLLAIDPPDVDG